NEVQHAIRDDNIDGFARNEWMLHAQLASEFFSGEEGVGTGDRARTQFCIKLLEIEPEILNPAFAKLDIGIADSLRDNRCVTPRDLEHRIGHIHADYGTFGTDDLRGDEANLPGAASEIKHGFAAAQIFAGIAATVIALGDFLRDDLEIARIVINRTAQCSVLRLRPGGVALLDGG